MLRTLDDLVAEGLVTADLAPRLRDVAARYAVGITPAMANLVDHADPADPIARQFVPTPAELDVTPDERADPIGDEAHSPVFGVVHRHADRVLVKVTGLCPVYCRFCFRREMIGPDADRELSPDEIARALDYIRADARIREVILTGGDPLILSARRIQAITAALEAIDHVDVIRWHTRVPVVAPDRVTDDLAAALAGTTKPVWIAVHANHARELSAGAHAAIARLRRAGLTLVSQTVLLKGVNADVASLGALMWAFVRAGVKPYYLHHPDLARGTGHFRLSIAEGQAIVAALRAELSGLAQPTYVLDLPGGVAKVPIAASHAGREAGRDVVRDPTGRAHAYPGHDRSEEPDG